MNREVEICRGEKGCFCFEATQVNTTTYYAGSTRVHFSQGSPMATKFGQELLIPVVNMEDHFAICSQIAAKQEEVHEFDKNNVSTPPNQQHFQSVTTAGQRLDAVIATVKKALKPLMPRS
jgi:hypothetical protein